MRIAAFVLGMILAMCLVGVASAASGAGFWIIVLRMLGTAFIAQILYLAAIALMARDEGAQSAQPKRTLNRAREVETR